jgi:uncharacterized protein
MGNGDHVDVDDVRSSDLTNNNHHNNNNNNNNQHTSSKQDKQNVLHDGISDDHNPHHPYQSLFRIRTITGFITFHHDDFTEHHPTTKEDHEDQPFMMMTTTTTTMSVVEHKIKQVSECLHEISNIFVKEHGYTVQTLRIATNPFGEWLTNHDNTNTSSSTASSLTTIDHHHHHNHDDVQQQQQQLDHDLNNRIQHKLNILHEICQKYHIQFCSLGPAETFHDLFYGVLPIITTSSIFSCSANLHANDTMTSYHIAKLIYQISQLHDHGLDNFRFCCASSNCVPYIPFFPVAKSKSYKKDDTIFHYAIGFENGTLFNHLLCNQTYRYRTNPKELLQHMTNGFMKAYQPIQTICQQYETTYNNNRYHNPKNNHYDHYHQLQYVGMDVSLNPSLSDGMNGSIVYTIEQCLGNIFGSPGTLALCSAMTTQCLQSPIFQSTIKTIGYNGIMLPLCEDIRLAQLASTTSISITNPNHRLLRISDLLHISNVCGVGIDTVPIPGFIRSDDNNTIHVDDNQHHEQKEQQQQQIQMLSMVLLDVVAIACKWNKSLTCRVLPIPNHHVNDMTHFDDSPYLINATIQSLL